MATHDPDMSCGDGHPLDAHGFPLVDHYYQFPPAMTTREYPAFDRPTNLQGQSWAGEHAFADAPGYDSVLLSPAAQTSPLAFCGDYASLSNSFTNALADGRPLEYFDLTAVPAATAPREWGAGLLSPEDSLASAMIDSPLASWHEEHVVAQAPRGRKEKQDDGPTDVASQDPRRRNKTAARPPPAEPSGNKTKKQKTKKGDDAKPKARTKGKPKPTSAATASIPTPSSSPSASSSGVRTAGGSDRGRRRDAAAGRAPGPGQSGDGSVVDSDADGDDDGGGWVSEGASPRLTQRERNRKAATKCRAKTKATTSQLAADEQAMADLRSALDAEVAALRQEALGLRLMVLEHHGCACAQMQAYIRNSARVIGRSGGRAVLFGPDGRGCPASPDAWEAAETDAGGALPT